MLRDFLFDTSFNNHQNEYSLLKYILKHSLGEIILSLIVTLVAYILSYKLFNFILYSAVGTQYHKIIEISLFILLVVFGVTCYVLTHSVRDNIHIPLGIKKELGIILLNSFTMALISVMWLPANFSIIYTSAIILFAFIFLINQIANISFSYYGFWLCYGIIGLSVAFLLYHLTNCTPFTFLTNIIMLIVYINSINKEIRNVKCTLLKIGSYNFNSNYAYNRLTFSGYNSIFITILDFFTNL